MSGTIALGPMRHCSIEPRSLTRALRTPARSVQFVDQSWEAGIGCRHAQTQAFDEHGAQIVVPLVQIVRMSGRLTVALSMYENRKGMASYDPMQMVQREPIGDVLDLVDAGVFQLAGLVSLSHGNSPTSCSGPVTP